MPKAPTLENLTAPSTSSRGQYTAWRRGAVSQKFRGRAGRGRNPTALVSPLRSPKLFSVVTPSRALVGRGGCPDLPALRSDAHLIPINTQSLWHCFNCLRSDEETVSAQLRNEPAIAFSLLLFPMRSQHGVAGPGPVPSSGRPRGPGNDALGAGVGVGESRGPCERRASGGKCGRPAPAGMWRSRWSLAPRSCSAGHVRELRLSGPTGAADHLARWLLKRAASPTCSTCARLFHCNRKFLSGGGCAKAEGPPGRLWKHWGLRLVTEDTGPQDWPWDVIKLLPFLYIISSILVGARREAPPQRGIRPWQTEFTPPRTEARSLCPFCSTALPLSDVLGEGWGGAANLTQPFRTHQPQPPRPWALAPSRVRHGSVSLSISSSSRRKHAWLSWQELAADDHFGVWASGWGADSRTHRWDSLPCTPFPHPASMPL